MPKLDVQPIDLLDEHENGATDSRGLLATRFPQSLAPAPERLELFFVQAHGLIVSDDQRRVQVARGVYCLTYGLPSAAGATVRPITPATATNVRMYGSIRKSVPASVE